MEKIRSFKKQLKNSKKIAIIANDAGGANILANLAEKIKEKKIYFSASGPAKKIFKKKKI